MPSSRSSKLLLAMACLAQLAGCADYLNRRDSITLGAGNASEANTAIQTIYPFPNNASDTNIDIIR
jgi:ABC-type uncharacterized transport system auxiliary subunit